VGSVRKRSRHLGLRILARAGGIALTAALFVPAAFSLTAAPAPWPEGASGRAARFGFGAAEHRYRIAGRIRLALFWVGRDDVGSARMSWQADGTTSALTLLIGSDPQRAPRRLNQWGYLREEQRPESAEVFSLRSVDDDGSDASAGFEIGDGPHFAVSCASVEDREVSSRQAKVAGHGITYRMFEQLLDRVPAASRWEHRQMPRPAGADAGFLTAIQHAIRLADMPAADGSVKRFQPVAYVYNNSVYDLTIQRRELLGRTAIGARTFEQLVRMDFSIRNRRTGDVSKFGITYSPEDRTMPLPVQIFYQPSFWLRIELQLDDTADVPADPASDGSVLQRIRSLCASSASQ
jgi:hypothetical protein